MYCIYLTIYRGTLLPKRYIGSSSVRLVLAGYNGSVSSIKWKDIYRSEQLKNKHLFKTRILQKYNTRKEALEAEYDLHIRYGVVRSIQYMNEALAQPNGFFGRDVSGKNNPMYGRNRAGEMHKGGENISDGLRRFYKTNDGLILIERAREFRLSKNNPWRGQKHSDEVIKHMRETRKGENNAMYGKRHSAESKERMSKTIAESYATGMRESHNKGKPMSEDQKNKLRKPKSKEWREKICRTYLINGVTVISNAKEYCLENGFNLGSFTSAAKHGIVYKGMTIEKINKTV